MKTKEKTQELSGLLSVLEDVKNSVIQEIGIEFPEIVVSLAREEKGKIHGHFTHFTPWKKGEKLANEIFLSAESLSRGAEDTMGTLLHELAHAYNFKNEIQDVTGDGYHNKKFQNTAQEIFSLKIEKSEKKGIGLSKTSMPEHALKRWKKEIEKIAKALDVTALQIEKGQKKSRNKNGIKAMCECGEIIRMSQKVLDNCRPMCQTCDTEFIAEENAE
jgi:hypothetical protein